MSSSVSETSLTADVFRYIRHQFRGRRGIVVAATALAAPALWFGWPWLVAAGLAPLLIAVAPCAIMCGLGICAMKACATPGGAQAKANAQPDEQSSTPIVANSLTGEITEPTRSEAATSVGACCAANTEGPRPDALVLPGKTLNLSKEKLQ